MSGIRREDNENSNGESSSILGVAGLVLAAGVGIGSALYYFFNKGQEDYEGEQAFRNRSASIQQCSICFAVLLSTERVTSLRCAHSFHSECILRWFRQSQTCPICRRVA